MLNRRRLFAALAITTATTTIAPAFAQTDQTAGNVVIYTSNNQQAVQAVTDTASTLLPKIKINAITGGSGQLLRRIEAETGKTQADIFWSSSPNTLGAFKSLYEPYKSPNAASIPADLSEPSQLWTAANIHVVVAMLNTSQLAGNAKPRTWTDLLDPKWKGKIIIADPANSSTAYTIIWGVKTLYGADALKKLAANVTVTSAAATVLRAVAQGEYAVGLTFESNAYAYVAGGQKDIELLYPEDGTFTSPESLVLIKGAPAGEAAKKVYDLLLAKETQIALLESAFRRPSRSDIDVTKHVKLPNLSSIKVAP
ncbi:MAG: extracellular solute-binding protein, partial [Beijerinckiaceae bacterium]